MVVSDRQGFIVVVHVCRSIILLVKLFVVLFLALVDRVNLNKVSTQAQIRVVQPLGVGLVELVGIEINPSGRLNMCFIGRHPHLHLRLSRSLRSKNFPPVFVLERVNASTLLTTHLDGASGSRRSRVSSRIVRRIVESVCVSNRSRGGSGVGDHDGTDVARCFFFPFQKRSRGF